MRRAAGALLPLELSILAVLLDLQQRRIEAAHGYAIAQAVRDRAGARRLTGYGTLYKALERLERTALVESRWEDPAAAAADGRPRRRYYRITTAGATALAAAAADVDGAKADQGRAASRRAEAPAT